MVTKALIPVSAVLALIDVVRADLPKKAPLSRYATLWSNSPFTSKPPPPEAGPASNPLDDYALIGVSPIGGSGYRVSLINKKKPDERIIVDSDKPSKDGFKVLEVIRKAGDPLGTIVRMNSGSMTGTVAFDTKLLTLTAAPKAAVPQPGVPGQPAQVPQVQPGQAPGNLPVRQPRPRVVPPPTPTAGAQVLPGAVPNPVPQGIPGLPVNQGQPNTQNLQQRPERRGN